MVGSPSSPLDPPSPSPSLGGIRRRLEAAQRPGLRFDAFRAAYHRDVSALLKALQGDPDAFGEDD